MASQQSNSIQTLLGAEKDATKVISEARQYRLQRLKEARTQASKEIEEYRQSKEKEFKAFEASHAGASKLSRLPLTKRPMCSVRRLPSNTRPTRTRSSRNCSTVSSS
ncbi:hypothetical protein QCA50_010626 [Cerrena zonata]|uniref:V-type proton ATPase subunit G n=1 Tax=Cerrena zonata TaxID=2478898 RepID=A0AAW0G4G1_9APHY